MKNYQHPFKRFKLSACKVLMLVSCGVFASLSYANSSQEHQTMKKQLKIMTNIIQSTAPESNRRSSAISIDSIYLKGQGIVFTLHANAHNARWGNFVFNFSSPEVTAFRAPPVAPVAPVAPSSTGTQIDIDAQVAESLEEAHRNLENIEFGLENERDKLREIRDEQRSLSYELRDLNREQRDLKYQLKRADKAAKVELEKQMKNLELQRVEAENQKKRIEKQSAELRKKQRAAEVKQNKERQAYYKNLAMNLADTLCVYGNGLRSLPKNEFVNIIVKSAGEKQGGHYQDKVYVFSKASILACAAEKMTAKVLLDKAAHYNF